MENKKKKAKKIMTTQSTSCKICTKYVTPSTRIEYKNGIAHEHCMKREQEQWAQEFTEEIVTTPPDHLIYNSERLSFDLLWALPPQYGPYRPMVPMYGPWLPADYDPFVALDEQEKTQ